jgi:hypothetical protein
VSLCVSSAGAVGSPKACLPETRRQKMGCAGLVVARLKRMVSGKDRQGGGSDRLGVIRRYAHPAIGKLVCRQTEQGRTIKALGRGFAMPNRFIRRIEG